MSKFTITSEALWSGELHPEALLSDGRSSDGEYPASSCNDKVDVYISKYSHIDLLLVCS